MSSEKRFKHTFYPSLANQDSYANSISDCLAGDLFGNKISKKRQSKTNTDKKKEGKTIHSFISFILSGQNYKMIDIQDLQKPLKYMPTANDNNTFSNACDKFYQISFLNKSVKLATKMISTKQLISWWWWMVISDLQLGELSFGKIKRSLCWESWFVLEFLDLQGNSLLVSFTHPENTTNNYSNILGE